MHPAGQRPDGPGSPRDEAVLASDRIVDIRAGGLFGVRRHGSGLLVSPGLILTARSLVTVPRPRGHRPWSSITLYIGNPQHGALRGALASVCWTHPGLDAALLRITAPLLLMGVRDDQAAAEDAGTQPPPVWGRLVSGKIRQYTAVAFPWESARAHGPRDIQQLNGRLRPVEQGCQLTEDLSPDAAPGDRWSGAVGAAVFCEGALVGLVTQDHRGSGSRRLDAVRAADLVADPDLRRLVERDAAGDGFTVADIGAPGGSWIGPSPVPHPPPGTAAPDTGAARTVPSAPSVSGNEAGDIHAPTVQAGHIRGDVHITAYEYLPPTQPLPGQLVYGKIPLKPASGFQRREGIQLELAHHADGGGTAVLSALTGMGGVGKTLAAAEYARLRQRQGWAVIAWLTAETREQIVAGLGELGHRLGLGSPRETAEELATRARDWLAATTNPCLLVLDNAVDLQDVMDWCPGAGRTQTVITSRNQSFARAFDYVRVDVFTPAQATAFLSERIGERARDQEEGRAGELARELGYLPLALAQAAAVIAKRGLTYEDYLHRFSDRERSLHDHLPPAREDPYPRGTAEAILLSVEAAEEATPRAREMLELISVLAPAGVPLRILYGAPGVDGSPAPADPAAVDELLGELADVSLLVFDEGNRTVLMHRLIQRVLRERARQQDRLGGIIDDAATILHEFNDRIPRDRSVVHARDDVDALVEQHDALWNAAKAVPGVRVPLLMLEGWCAHHLGAIAEHTRAIPMLEANLRDRHREFGATDYRTLNNCYELGLAYLKARRPEKAVRLLESTLADCEEYLGPDHPLTTSVRTSLLQAREEGG